MRPRLLKPARGQAATGVATPADWYDGDVAISPDDRPERTVIDQFDIGSIQLLAYLRVVART